MSEEQRKGSDDQLVSLDVRAYLRILRKYKWVIVATIAVAITATVVYTSRLTKMYSGRATIVIDPSAPDYLGVQEIVPLGTGGYWWNVDYYDSQVKILESYALARRAIEATDLHRRLLQVEEGDSRSEEQLIDTAARRLRKLVKVDLPEQSRIVSVTVLDPDPELAAFMANAIVDAYLDYNLDLRSEGTELASEWLAKEFDMASAALKSSELELFQYKRDNDMLSVSLEDRQNIISNNIQRYTSAMNDSRTKRIELGALLTRVKSFSNTDILESPIFALVTDTSLETLKTEYYLERAKFLEIEKTLGPKHPDHRKQQEKVEELHGALEREARVVMRSIEERYKAAQAAEKAFATEVERYKEEAFALGRKVVDYNRLERDEKDNAEKYKIVLGRLRTTDLSSRLKTINVRRLDPARASAAPVYPNMQQNVAIAAVASLMLGCLLAFLLQLLDQSIKTAEDVQRAAGAPLLGIVPALPGMPDTPAEQQARDLYVFENPSSPVAECCRSIRTNILFSAADRTLKTIVVSSPSPREGKTTIVMYLGTTMAQSGQRVLLIDSDMRRPRIHKSTGVSRNEGLSSLIVGDVEIDDVIKTTDVPNLFVLPCGPLPPNPAELLMTQRFGELLKELEGRFDRILLDSPPVLAVTDSVVLARQADGVMLVAKAGKTARSDVERAAGQLTDVDAPLFGVVLNELDLENREYGYYYQYYSYGYGAADGKAEAAGQS